MNSDFFDQLARRGVGPGEVTERFCRASGPGGQHVNKVSTAVELVCPSLGLEVGASGARSQFKNRLVAWQRLIEAIDEREKALRSARRSAAERKRRATRPRPKVLKKRILESKRRRGEIKKLRGRVQ